MTADASPRRGVLLLRSFRYGGGTRVEIDAAAVLARSGRPMDAIGADGGVVDLAAHAAARTPGFSRIEAPGSRTRLAWRLARRRYEVAVVGRSKRVYGALRLASRLPFARRPATVVVLHEHYPRYLGLLAEGTRRLADVLLLMHDFRDEAEAAFHLPRERMVVAHPLYEGLLEGRDAEAQQRGRALRARRGIAASSVVIGYYGRVTERKGLLFLLEATRRLLAEGADVHLVVAGRVGEAEAGWEARWEAEARAVGAARGGPSRVHLLGAVGDPAGTLAAFDLQALCTQSEGYLPLALVEGMSCGVPVVTTGVGGIATALRDDVDALVVPKVPDDETPVDVATGTRFEHALRRLVGDAALRRRLGEAGRARVEALVASADFAAGVARATALALEARAGG